jgi:hypothetical protein
VGHGMGVLSELAWRGRGPCVEVGWKWICWICWLQFPGQDGLLFHCQRLADDSNEEVLRCLT